MSSDLAISCMKKASELRTVAEIDILIPWLRIKSALFADLDKEIVADILKNCEYEERETDDVVIKQGEKGNSFYVILSGKVSVYINTEAVVDEEALNKLPVPKPAVGTLKKTHSEKIATLDRTKFGKYIAPIDAGKSFGELALINDDCVRNASIICDEVTHLLVVYRDLFNRCLRAAAEAKLKEKRDFVEQCSVFEGWPTRYKRQVYMSLSMEKFTYGSEMVKQGEPVNGLIFLLSGQATYVMDTIAHQNQFPQFKLHLDQAELRKLNFVNEISERGNSDSDKAAKFTAIDHRRMGYKEAEKRMAKRRVEALIIRPGEIIGDLEQGFGLSTYAQSVICTQQCSAYIFDAKNFERLISPKKNAKTLLFLRQRAEMRILSLATRMILEEMQVPLFTALMNIVLDEYNKAKEDEMRKRKKTLSNSLGSKVDLRRFESFIPPRGPVIDLYGPGTVFFRTRMLRRKARSVMNAEEFPDKEEEKQMTTPDTPSSQTVLNWDGPVPEPILPLSSRASRESMSLPLRRRSTLSRFSIFASLESRPRKKASKPFDWESGSEHLQALEGRLRNWHCQFSAAECDAAKDCVRQMKRFIKQEDVKIHPGKKIRLIPKSKAEGPSVDLDYGSDENSTDSDDWDDAFLTRIIQRRQTTRSNSSLKNDTNELHLPPIAPKVSLNPLTKTKIIENTAAPQYTAEEYKELKKLMQQRERQLATFMNYLYA